MRTASRLERAPSSSERTVVRLHVDGRPAADFELSARARPEAQRVLRALRARGLELGVLTGDSLGPARALARELDVSVEAELLPAEKLERIRAAGAGTVYVGDGLNDGAALAAASVGISVQGSAFRSMEAAQVNLLHSDLTRVVELYDLARDAVSTARRNLAWALSYNALGLGFAASGRLSPLFAASAMVVSSAVVVLVSSRVGAPQCVREKRPAPASTLRAAR